MSEQTNLDLKKLPKGWAYHRIENLVDGKRGITYGVVQPGKDFHGGVPFIRAGDLRNGRVQDDELKHISPDIARDYERSKLQGGELLLSLVGRVGETAIVPDRLIGANIARAVAVIPIYGGVGAEWVQLCLKTKQPQRLIANWCNTTVQHTLNLSDVKRLPIPIPPLPTQRRIAEILGALDDKIELNRRMNETLEAMAQTLYRHWFVDFGPFQDQPFVDSELGPIPEGWHVGLLGDLVGFINGYAFKSAQWQEQGIPVVKIGSINPGIVDLQDKVSFVSQKDADETKKRYHLQEADLLIGMTGYVGEVGIVPPSEPRPLLNQRVGRFDLPSRGTVDLSFIYCLTRQSTFRENVKSRSTGTAQANVSATAIKSIPIVIPPEDILAEFNSICKTYFDLILSNLGEIQTLTEIRDYLLPKLISGEIEVEAAEDEVNSAVA